MDLDYLYLEVNSYNTRNQANEIATCIRDINEALYNLRNTTEVNGYRNLLSVINSFDLSGMINQLTIAQNYLNHIADITEKYEKMLSNQKVFSKSLALEHTNFTDSDAGKYGEIAVASGVSRYASILEKQGDILNSDKVDKAGGAGIDFFVDGYDFIARYIDIYDNHEKYNLYKDLYDSGNIYISEYYNQFYERAHDVITDLLVVDASLLGAGAVAEVVGNVYKKMNHVRSDTFYEYVRLVKNEGVPENAAEQLAVLRFGTDWVVDKLSTPKNYLKILDFFGVDFGDSKQNYKDVLSFIGEKFDIKDVVDNISDEGCINATGKTRNQVIADYIYTNIYCKLLDSKAIVDASNKYVVEWAKDLFNGGDKK